MKHRFANPVQSYETGQQRHSTAKKKDEIHFECTCSKGTYIRSLARDIGYAVNSGAHLINLRRTSSGDFHIKNAKTVDEWIDIIKTS